MPRLVFGDECSRVWRRDVREVFSVSGVHGIGCLAGVREQPEVNSFVANADFGNPLTPTLVNAHKAGRVVSPAVLVDHVSGTCQRAQVAVDVVEFIPVDVVDFDLRWNRPVVANVDGIVKSDFPDSPSGSRRVAGGVTPVRQVPSVGNFQGEVFWGDECPASHNAPITASAGEWKLAKVTGSYTVGSHDVTSFARGSLWSGPAGVSSTRSARFILPRQQSSDKGGLL